MSQEPSEQVQIRSEHVQARSEPVQNRQESSGFVQIGSRGGLAKLLGQFFRAGSTGGVGGEAGQAVKNLLKTFHLEEIDTGDILLALIVLFLILEDGDSLDLIITLGLMILFSLGDP